MNDWGSIVAVGGDGQSNAAPRVSVNIIVFDKNYNFLDVAFDQIDPAAEQVGVTPVVAHDLLSKEYTVKEEGYVFMYIANENQTQVDAYFDDVAMTYTPTNIVQYNEYYPFGLQATTSWTRENNTNNFLYNEGSELNADAGWYETMFRSYDPTVGRFMQIDPISQMTHTMSPYQYANDSPILLNDPTGLKAPAGVSESAYNRLQRLQGLQGISSGDVFSNWDVDDGGGGYWAQFEYRFFYDDGHEAQYKRYREWEWVDGERKYSGNLILNFTNSLDYGRYSNSGWNIMSANSVQDGVAKVKNYLLRGGSLKNLVVLSHGGEQGLVLGKTKVTASDYKNGHPFASMLNAILAQVSPGGRVAFIGCKSGVGLAPAMQEAARCDIEIFMNTNYNTSASDANFNAVGFYLDQPLSYFPDVDDGIIEVSSGRRYKDLVINSNGTINIIEK